MGKNRRAAVRDYGRWTATGPRDFPVVQPEPEKLRKPFRLLATGAVKPGSAAIEEVLRQMGKTKPSDEAQLRLLRVRHLPGQGSRRTGGQGGGHDVPALLKGQGRVLLRPHYREQHQRHPGSGRGLPAAV